MKLLFTKAENFGTPPEGFGFAFVDIEDKKLKIKKHDGVIEFNNDLSDIQLLDLIDNTAFEVFAHDYDIPAKTLIANTSLADKIYDSEVLSDMIYVALPACMIHSFKLRTMQPDINKSDIVIDWGDGTILPLKDNEVTSKLSPEISEGDYTVTHTYSNTGKYVVKIFGKDYYNFVHSATNNILCRIFDNDLPIASHLGSLANSAMGSNHLLFVSGETIKYRSWSNLGGLCSLSKNLLKAIGFSKNFVTANCRGAFQTCSNLKFADMQVPFKSFYTTAGEHMYNSCSKLAVDIAKLIPDIYLEGGPFSLYATFNNTPLLSGTVPAEKLWKNKNASFSNTECFAGGVNAEIKAQVPVSWGGTNANLDNELLIEDKDYYTAFELYPNSEVIPVGEHVDLGTISTEIAANTIHKFEIRTMDVDYLQSDIVVDWGDGTIESVKNQNYIESDISEEDGEGDYTFSHDYAEALNAASVTGKKFIIKIYGKRYYNIRYNLGNKWSNLICRVIDYDLPLAPHYKNLASICDHAYRLTSVSFETIKYGYYESLYDAFKFCNNLTKAIGFGRAFLHSLFTNAFYGCTSLTYTDALLPFDAKNNSPARGMFALCENLEMDINDLIPNVMHADGKYDLLNTFSGCSKLSGTVPADKLWNNKKYQFTNTHYCFDRCSEELMAQVPISWGGTASDDIIEKSLEEKYNDLLARVEALESK